jgi:hypothetical protein
VRQCRGEVTPNNQNWMPVEGTDRCFGQILKINFKKTKMAGGGSKVSSINED